MLMVQIILIAYGGIIEAAVQKGLGRHIEWVVTAAPQNAVPIALLGQVSQPFVVMSCALGKTSFSISLMRLASQPFIHRFLWFIVVTMLILHILISIIVFVRCKDPRTTWNPAIVSECWAPHVYLGVMYFIGGKLSNYILPATRSSPVSSLLCCYRLHLSSNAMGYVVEPQHEEEGKVWCRRSNESRCLVSSFNLAPSATWSLT